MQTDEIQMTETSAKTDAAPAVGCNREVGAVPVAPIASSGFKEVLQRALRIHAAQYRAKVAKGCRQIWQSNRALTIVVGASAIFGIGFLFIVIGPRYSDPSTRLYSTKLGFGTVSRKLGRPFPVSGHTAATRRMESRLHGEGLLATEPIQVPIVAMTWIKKVHVKVGDRVKKGQLIVEMDSRRAEVKLEAAKSALKTALLEKERVVIGSSYVSANERPEKAAVSLDTAEKLADIQEQLAAINKALKAKDASSRAAYLQSQVEFVASLDKLSQAKLDLKVAAAGQKLSIGIADCAIVEAKLACKFRELELEDYKVFSPCDGIIERCLVHSGEYNQDPGKPALLVDEGLWFEARMDQTNTGRIAIGDPATVFLEAFPNQPLTGRVTRVVPVVSYDLGGPEATRPMRPLGSGAPEWPSTYATRIELDAKGLPLMPGLTGFAQIDNRRDVLAIPIEALLARSGRSALVYVVKGSCYQPCKVVLGSVTGGWAEIKSGINEGDVVLTDGHQVLEPGDKIALTARDDQALVPALVLESDVRK